MRDQTFWFLFVLSLYLLWRAVTEVRLWLFIAAGVTIPLAAAMRFEGLLLLIPLGLWSCWRWRALGQSRTKIGGRRIASQARVRRWPYSSGSPGCPAARQPTFSAPGRCCWPGDGWSGWSRRLLGNHADLSPLLPRSLGPISPGRMLEIYLPTVLKGLTPLYVVLLGVGIAGSRRLWTAPRPCGLGAGRRHPAAGDVGAPLGRPLVVQTLCLSPGAHELRIRRTRTAAVVGLHGAVRPEHERDTRSALRRRCWAGSRWPWHFPVIAAPERKGSAWATGSATSCRPRPCSSDQTVSRRWSTTTPRDVVLHSRRPPTPSRWSNWRRNVTPTPCCCPRTRQISAATDLWSAAWKRPDFSRSPPGWRRRIAGGCWC